MGHYTISSDRSQLVFEQQTDLTGRTGWFSMPVDGGPVTAASAPKEDLRPFVLRDEQILLLVGNGTSLTTASPPEARVTTYALAPDGKSIAFAASRFSGPSGLYILENSGRLSWLGDLDSLAGLNWSPDGKGLIFIAPMDGVDQVFYIQRDGQVLNQLTTDHSRKSSPRWSPDGRSIAYLAESGPGPLAAGRVTPTPDQLVLAPTPTPTQAYDPLEPFLPMPTKPAGGPTQTDIFWMDADGSHPRRLTQDSRTEFNLEWINSREIAFAARLPQKPQAAYLYAVDSTSGSTRRVYPPLEITSLACPARLPGGETAPVEIAVTNSGLSAAEAPVVLRTGSYEFPTAGSRASGVIRAATLRIPPGETLRIAWPVTALSSLSTHVSVLINIGEAFPMSEQRCVISNTYLGLPNLPLMPFVLPLMVSGMLLCLPWLRHRRKRVQWILWFSVPFLLALLIAAEVYLSIRFNG